MQSSSLSFQNISPYVQNSNLHSPKVSPQILPPITTWNGSAWDKFKALFSRKDEVTRFLELGNFEDTKKIAHLFLTVNPFSYNGHLLKNFLKTGDAENVKSVLTEVFNQIFEGTDFKFEKILSFFEAGQLEGLIENEDVPAKLAEMAECLPERSKIKQSIPSTIKKTFQVVLRFFPNFLDTALKAFNLLEAGKKPETLWDFAAMLDIYYKMFMIPHAVFIVVGTFVSVPLNAILITSAIVLGLVIGVCLYLKYRPLTNNLSRSDENLTQMANDGALPPVVGRDLEIEKIKSYLGKKEDSLHINILLVGETGVGKTQIVNGIAQCYHEKTIFSMNAPDLSGGYSPLADVLRLIKLDINGHKNEAIFFIDEFAGAVQKKSTVIDDVLKPLLDKSGVQIIAAVTKEEFEKYIFPNKPILRRFYVINIDPTTPEQTVAILRKKIETKGGNIRFAKDIARTIYELTKDKLQPSDPDKYLDLAILTVSAFNIDSYAPKELLDAKSQFKQKQEDYEIACNNRQDDTSSVVKDLKALKITIQEMELENRKIVKTALKIRKLIGKQRKLLRRRNTLAKQEPLDNKELVFLNWFLLPWIENKIESTIKDIPAEIPLQIDENLIKGLIN